MPYENIHTVSLKSRIYKAFTKGGREKATKLAEKLGVTRKLDRWLTEFGATEHHNAPPKKGKPAKSKTVTTTSSDNGGGATGHKQCVLKKNMRVCERGVGKRRPGTIIDLGQQVSGVHWDNFIVQYHANKNLYPE